MSVKSRSDDQEPGTFLIVQQHILKVISAFPPGLEARLLVAVSGGADSMLLFRTLVSCGFKGLVAHVNYGLRGKESDLDEQFVVKQADAEGWPVKVLHAVWEMAEHPGESTQMAARRLRYQWFEKLRSENQLDFIITAHHANDNAETIIINFLRGSGIKGLSGMSELNGFILRPLLRLSSPELRQAAADIGLEWREDSSNETDDYLRNRIRHHLLPALLETDPKFFKKLEETFIRLNSEHSLLHELIDKQRMVMPTAADGGLSIKKQDLEKFADPGLLLYQIIKKYGFSHAVCIQACGNLTAQHRRTFYSGQWELVLERSEILISKGIEAKKDELAGMPDHFSFEELSGWPHSIDKIPVSEAFIDVDKICGKWQVRTWLKADRFYPSGMKGSKLISDYYTDLKLSLQQKNSQLLLCNNEEIVWVVNRRIDSRFAASRKSRNILRITFTGDIQETTA